MLTKYFLKFFRSTREEKKLKKVLEDCFDIIKVFYLKYKENKEYLLLKKVLEIIEQYLKDNYFDSLFPTLLINALIAKNKIEIFEYSGLKFVRLKN